MNYGTNRKYYMLRLPPIKKGKPYTGITDFTSYEQVKAMLKVFNAHKPRGSKRLLHVGVMMSRKTLCGLPTKFADIFPKNEEVASIFQSRKTYNCLHYADSEYDHFHTLSRNLYNAIMLGGIGMDALQLDLCWPNPADVAGAINSSRRNPEVILQIGRKAFDQVDNNPQVLIDRLFEYRTFIHRVLLDKSMGEGLGMDAEKLLPFVEAVSAIFPEMKIVVAGGLGPKTMHLIEPLLKEFPNLSIDAQGKLRPSGSYLDPIDWDMAGEYLARSFDYLK